MKVPDGKVFSSFCFLKNVQGLPAWAFLLAIKKPLREKGEGPEGYAIRGMKEKTSKI